ncbi:MAG: ATP-binding cassette domain-containing protein [Clostridia bacterium]
MISLAHATKRYGKAQVLSDVTVTFEKGKIHGLVGRNGSGKTVLLKIICGLIGPSEGTVTVNGKRVEDGRTPEGLIAMIETPGFLPYYSGRRNLCLLYSIRNRRNRKKVEEAMLRVGLDPMSRKWTCKYSMGMRQRLGIAQAIMEEPELFLLDEPMNGLDNQGVADMRKLFLELKAQGKTIVLASHSREDIEVLCDHVYEMDEGRLTRIS